jgi:ribosomal protein S6--L-glutamate ligase
VAAYKRQGQEGEFRSNLHRGGMGVKIKLSALEKKTAIAATKALGLNVAGVDMLRSDRGPLVLEVNSSPGIEGVERVTGIDVADKIIAFVETQIDRPLTKTKDKVGV